MKYGYSRACSTDPNLSIEIEELKMAGCGVIYFDEILEDYRFGPSFLKMIEKGKKGDIVIVQRLDRLCGTLIELSTISQTIIKAKMGLIVLKEQIDTQTFEGQLFLHSIRDFNLNHLAGDFSVSTS